jgi:hypothetical protein
VPVFPPVPDPYASLTPAELATFGIAPARAPNDDDDEVEEATIGDVGRRPQRFPNQSPPLSAFPDEPSL